jgi:hypothetical protein
MTILRRLALLAAVASVAAAGALARPSAALASCRLPLAIQEAVNSADIVFVGTVVGTENGNAWATVRIEEIWRGPDQPASVVVRGGPGGNTATSVDRSFEVGVRYLFFPFAGENGVLSDNACSSTTPWSAELAALRPAGARVLTPPTGQAGFDPMSIVIPAGVALLVAALLLGAGLLARGRDRA